MSKKIVSMGVAFLSTIFLATVSTTVTKAETINSTPVTNITETTNAASVIENKENELRSVKESVKGTELEATVNDAITKVDNMKASLRAANPTTIYDLGTIGARVEALTDVINAIVFSTTQLTNKIDKAHIDMGFAITKLVIRLVDPFASIDSIKEQSKTIESLKQATLTYPDLKLTDRATIYKKAVLDKAIWNTRFERDKKILGVKSFTVYNTLNQAITHAVGVQLNPNVSVADVDIAVNDLQNALSIALNS